MKMTGNAPTMRLMNLRKNFMTGALSSSSSGYRLIRIERFTERQNTQEKQWKITEEDWRNRDKWDQYEQAVNEMIAKTSTTYAPWHILESVDKKYARIKAMKIVVEELEKALKVREESCKKM